MRREGKPAWPSSRSKTYCVAFYFPLPSRIFSNSLIHFRSWNRHLWKTPSGESSQLGKKNSNLFTTWPCLQPRCEWPDEPSNRRRSLGPRWTSSNWGQSGHCHRLRWQLIAGPYNSCWPRKKWYGKKIFLSQFIPDFSRRLFLCKSSRNLRKLHLMLSIEKFHI